MANKSFKLLSEFEPKEIEHLWSPYVPLGELTLIDGDPGTNKSSLTLNLATRVSRGLEMPDGNRHPAGGVVLLQSEDSIEKTVIPRLDALGADRSRIAILDDLGSIPDDLNLIEEKGVEIGSKLVIIDPLMGFLSSQANTDQSVRKALTPLKRFAERHNLAVLLVRHLNKSGQGYALYRGSGSIGIVGAARSAVLIGKDPQDPNMRVLCHTKSNLTPQGPSLLFEPLTHDNGAVRIEWRGECDYTPEDLLAPPNKKPGKLDEAMLFLMEALKGGPVEQVAIQQAAAGLGIAYRTIERAKQTLGVVSNRQGFGPGSVVYWSLPRSEDHTPPNPDGGVCEPSPNGEPPGHLTLWQPINGRPGNEMNQ